MTDITKIAVLDYSDPSVDIIDVNNKMLRRFNNDIERYLTDHCGYNPDNINWMDATKAKLNLNMTHDSFSGCDNDEDTYWDDEPSIKRFKYRQVRSIEFDVVIDGKEYKNLGIYPDWDGTDWSTLHQDDGPWFELTIEEGKTCCDASLVVDFQVYADEDGELFLQACRIEMFVEAGKAPWWEHTTFIDDLQVTNFFVDYYEEGNMHEDEIWVSDKLFFGDNEEHKLKMWFYDGYAIEQTDINNVEGIKRHPYILIYPTLEQADNSEWMLNDVREYTGREDVVPYDIALKFGKLYTEKEIMNY